MEQRVGSLKRTKRERKPKRRYTTDTLEIQDHVNIL
jgi:hypothetical protein